MLTWSYKRFFSCDSKDVLYILYILILFILYILYYTYYTIYTIYLYTIYTIYIIYILSYTDIYYILIFYIRQTEELKQRTQKHKSDVIHPNYSNCKKSSEHLRTCSKMTEPCFNMYPFCYKESKYLRDFRERHYIMNWKPQLKSYNKFLLNILTDLTIWKIDCVFYIQ